MMPAYGYGMHVIRCHDQVSWLRWSKVAPSKTASGQRTMQRTTSSSSPVVSFPINPTSVGTASAFDPSCLICHFLPWKTHLNRYPCNSTLCDPKPLMVLCVCFTSYLLCCYVNHSKFVLYLLAYFYDA